MVWIRRVRTASGATAVQIAESVGGRRRIVRHVGSARDEAELGLLVEQARRLLADDAQRELDLGITPKAAKVEMVGPPAATLFTDTGAGPRQLVARAQVLKSCSALLYDALAGVYADLGFDDAVDDQVFRDLVITRVVEPTSLLDVDRVLAELGRTSASLSTRKRTLRRASAGGYRAQIASACFNNACATGDLSLVLYDVTTLYFEAEKEDDLRKVGYSKERRVDPQIVVGESPWKSRRLLTLETRMQVCRRNSRQVSPQHAVTARRRRPPRCGWSGRCGLSWAPSRARWRGWRVSSVTGSSRSGPGCARPISTTGMYRGCPPLRLRGSRNSNRRIEN